MIKKTIFTALTALIIVSSVSAQSWKLRRWEIAAGIGTAHIFGDFTGESSLNNENLYGIKDVTIPDSRPSVMLAMRFKATERISARMNFIYGRGFADGSISSANPRDAFAKTNIIEITPQGEFYFLKEGRKFKSSAIFNKRGMVNNFATISGYVFGGVGGLIYNPNIEGESFINSQEPGEIQHGQTSFTATFPAGVGFKYILDSRLVLGFEVGGRYTLSDYIDGFSSEFSNARDIYYFTSFNVSYKLKTNRNGWPEFDRRRGGGLPFGGGSSSAARSARQAKRGGGDPNAGFFNWIKGLFDGN
jgi:hypothetical protein